MLKSIFYARFHPERGPDIFYEHPLGTGSKPANDSAEPGQDPLFTFSDISAYLIPPHYLANRNSSICASGHRILGFPISIEDPRYQRNRFVFNVCFVLDEDVEPVWVKAWEGVVAKLALFLKGLELEGKERGLLSREEKIKDAGGMESEDGVVTGVLREVWEQVGEFGECCVRVSETQVLNLRLDGPAVGGRGVGGGRKVGKERAWEVPLLVREMPRKERETWDLVYERIVPFIDGVNCVKRIAGLADVDLAMTRKAVGQLVKSGRVVMLDLFHFQAIYMLNPDFTWFVEDTDMMNECRKFVAIDPKTNIFAGAWTQLPRQHTDTPPAIPEKQTLITLYSALEPGLSVADFCLAHEPLIHNIDIRRLILFGTIKGFLRRIHKYALALDPPPLPSPVKLPPSSSITATTTTPEDIDRAWRKAALSSGWATPPADVPVEMVKGRGKSEEERVREEDARLVEFFDGTHCLDEVCVEMRMSEKCVIERVRSGRFGEVVFTTR